MADVVADPSELARYGAVLAETVPRLDRLAEDLVRACAGDPDRAGAAAELGWRVRGLAAAEAATGRWVAAVGLAFEAADRGPSLLAIDVLADLAAAGDDARVTAAGVAPLVTGRRAAAGVVPAVAVALGTRGVEVLARAHPDLVGNVDGMPIEARVAANRRLVSRALATETDPARRRALAALLADDPRTGRPRQILAFDPSGDGRVAEVFGDLRTARSVAVVVPGMATDLANFSRTVARPASALARRAAAAGGPGRAGGVAVVAWLGYDPPDGLVADVDELGALARDQRARVGGRDLAAFVAGLGLRTDQRVTLVGHSYGSTTVAAAVLAGARADNVVVLGSPGVLVDRASEFHRPDTDFFALAAPHDVVAELGWFGPPPARPGSGFRRLATGGRGHSAYLVDGSTAQANLVAVLLDRDDLLVTG